MKMFIKVSIRGGGLTLINIYHILSVVEDKSPVHVKIRMKDGSILIVDISLKELEKLIQEALY